MTGTVIPSQSTKKPKFPICSICGQVGVGPLEARQDGSGKYRHCWGCKFISHKGQQCHIYPLVLCQESDGCLECNLWQGKYGNMKVQEAED